MTTITIEKVAPDVRSFETANGKFAAFKVLLADGRTGEVVAKADNVAKRQEQFRGFIGTPTDLIIEDAGAFPDGAPKPLRVKIPQQQQGGGKGRDYVPRYTDTAEGWRESDERVDRRRALELAQAEGVGITTELATKFYEWLRATAKEDLAAASAQQPAESRSSDGQARHADPVEDAAAERVEGDEAVQAARGDETKRPSTSVSEEVSGEAADQDGTPLGPLTSSEVSDPEGHEPVWGPSPRKNLAAKGWKICTFPGCGEPSHSPRQEKSA